MIDYYFFHKEQFSYVKPYDKKHNLLWLHYVYLPQIILKNRL